MTPTISQLRTWDPATFKTAAGAATKAASQLDSSIGSVQGAIDKAEDWTGMTHTAATAKAGQERDHVDEIRTALLQIADAGEDANTDIAQAKTFTLEEVDTAKRNRCAVSDTGEVTPPADADEYLVDQAKTMEARIKDGLRTCGDFDRQYGKQIADLCRDLTDMREGQPDVTVPGGRKMDPDDAISYLRSLNQEQRREFLSKMSEDDIRRLVQADPKFMGNTDGVPFNVRAESNETLIRAALADEERAGRGGGERANKLREMLAQNSDPGGNGRPGRDAAAGPDDKRSERRFIVFENTKNGRIIEMIGKLDKDSRSATVYVPGTTTNLDGSASNYKAAWELADRTKGPVFFYMDGDLPQELGDKAVDPLKQAGIGGVKSLVGALSGNPFLAGQGLLDTMNGVNGVNAELKGSAADPSFARDMAPKLVSFGRELDSEIASAGSNAKTTYIGHSYGGSVVGSAEQLGLRADNVIYASSAGSGVFDGDWKNANPDVKRFSMTAPGDMIQYVQSLPGSPHGGDPDHAPGVTRMDTGYWDEANRSKGFVSGTDGHGKYWDNPNSTAFQNMVDVVNGDEPSEYVERENDRPTDKYWSLMQTGAYAVPIPGFGILVDGADGDIDMPGPIPDIRLPWR